MISFIHRPRAFDVRFYWHQSPGHRLLESHGETTTSDHSSQSRGLQITGVGRPDVLRVTTQVSTVTASKTINTVGQHSPFHVKHAPRGVRLPAYVAETVPLRVVSTVISHMWILV